MTETAEKEHISDFACSCGAEKEKAMAELRAWARDQSIGIKHRDERDNLVSGVLYALNWKYRVAIDQVGVDQWMAVLASTWSPADTTFSIQCDQFEDGVSLLLKKCFERWGKERPWPPEDLT